jgi:cyclophilin family peptidyl-prolyl cis-trans isomerase/DNA-directed RNA polymerase subunit RPC12/RpoP
MVYAHCPACSSSVAFEGNAQSDTQVACPHCGAALLAAAPELREPELDDEEYAPDFDETKDWRGRSGPDVQERHQSPLAASRAIGTKQPEKPSAAGKGALQCRFWFGVLVGAGATLLAVGVAWRQLPVPTRSEAAPAAASPPAHSPKQEMEPMRTTALPEPNYGLVREEAAIPDSFARERKAAETFLRAGGSLEIVMDGDREGIPHVVASLDDLPDRGWTIRLVNLGPNSKVEHLEPLKLLPEFRQIETAQSAIPARDVLAHLDGIDRITFLGMNGARLTSEDLKSIVKHPEIRGLQAYRAKWGDEEVKQLLQLTKVQELNLGGTQITDAALSDLAQLPRLRALYLASTNVSLEGLKHLVNCTTLRFVYVGKTRVTEEEAAAFRELRPDCTVQMLAKLPTAAREAAAPEVQPPGADPQKWKREQELRIQEAVADDLPRVRLVTTKGEMVVELFENEAPNTVANFISLVEKGFYNGLTFHRVIPDFVAQGGDPLGNGTGGPGYFIAAEFDKPNARRHFPGSLAMARSKDHDSAGSQFYITYTPQPHLDGQYTVFGRVIEGIDIVSKLNATRSGAHPDKILRAEVLRKRNHEYIPRTIPK